jgi:hypothetical protein
MLAIGRADREPVTSAFPSSPTGGKNLQEQSVFDHQDGPLPFAEV